jgi:hypothetical protein
MRDEERAIAKCPENAQTRREQLHFAIGVAASAGGQTVALQSVFSRFGDI